MIPVAAGSQTTAGTAGNGYRVPRPAHPFTPGPPEHGRRPTCRICGAEKHAIPTPRARSER